MRAIVMTAGLLVIAMVFFFWLSAQVGGFVAGGIAVVLILLARPWRAGSRRG